MNPVIVVLAIGLAGAAAARVLRRVGDARNIERLQRRYKCNRAQAERLYRLARRDGFGSAYREVFGDRPTVESAPDARLRP